MSGISRKRRAIAIGIGAATLGGAAGVGVWLSQRGDDKASSKADAGKPWRPSYLDRRDVTLVDRLTDLIIPASDTPGASQARVVEYIDAHLARGAAKWEKDTFKGGLAWLRERARTRYGGDLLSLPRARQEQLLRSVSDVADARDARDKSLEAGRGLFRLLKRWTIKGYYTSEIGRRELGLPLILVGENYPGCSRG
ncbi:MAG: gluconate 2-dehydrogenase subunit 3 family protein [Myxococcales bacterium]|nr:gluconate 2-dehydrogenase subunit 3 family protein [Myxococcales bacterium]